MAKEKSVFVLEANSAFGPEMAASPSFTSPAVSLLIKTISPFQAVYNTSPGGSSEISSSLYESLTYLVLVII